MSEARRSIPGLERVEAIIRSNPELDRAARIARFLAAAGGLVSRLREEQGMTPAWLAEQTGMTEEKLKEIERGLGEEATVGDYARLFIALGVEPELHYGKPSPPPLPKAPEP